MNFATKDYGISRAAFNFEPSSDSPTTSPSPGAQL